MGIVFIILGFRDLKKKRLIENTPTSKIRSIALGFVEIYGKVLSAGNKSAKDTYAVAPLTGKKCVYYNVQIQEYRSQGKSSRWVTVHTDEFRQPFYIKDETGKVMVDPCSAKIEIEVSYQSNSGIGNNPAENVVAYLKKKDLNHEGFFGFNKTMRYMESCIKKDDSLYIMGEAMSSGNQSGVGSDNIIVGKKNKRSFFFISDKPEKEILKKLRLRSRVFFIIGILLAVIFSGLMFGNYILLI